LAAPWLRGQRRHRQGDLVQRLERRVDFIAGHCIVILAKRCQRVFNCVGVVGDLTLFYHACGAFEGMSEPQHQGDQLRRDSSLIELERAFAELIQQLTRFDAKVSVGIACHRCRLCGSGARG
jgi:hypothetical protein